MTDTPKPTAEELANKLLNDCSRDEARDLFYGKAPPASVVTKARKLCGNMHAVESVLREAQRMIGKRRVPAEPASVPVRHDTPKPSARHRRNASHTEDE